MCFTGTGCPAIPKDSPAPTDPDPTIASTLLAVYDTSSPSYSSSMPAPVNLDSSSPTVSNTTPTPTSAIESMYLTTSLPTVISAGGIIDISSDTPTMHNTQKPMDSQSTLNPSPPTSSKNRILIFPDVAPTPVSKSPLNNIALVEKILENAKPTLVREVFVVETRGGTVLPSNVYTYHGFLSSLLYCSNYGIGGDHFYLGGDDTIQSGLVNLALFLAKVVTDAVVYESCGPNKVACGVSAIDTIFQDNTRFLCSGTSKNAGLECLDASIGCACVLGLLDHHIGSKSIPDSTPYSDVQFCSTDPYESVCSKYLDKGEELKWLTPMAYWVTFVQRYQSTQQEIAQTYMSKLRSFVNDGMKDSSFIEYVAHIGIHESIQKVPASKFLRVYSKVIDLLLGGLDMQSTSPSKHPTQSPVAPPTRAVSLSNKPTNRPRERATGVPISEPTTAKPSGAVCPLLCVVPVKTVECPSPSQKLKHCFRNFIGRDEICIAAYGECDTSNHSVNDCGSSYNVFRRIDCSLLSDYPHSEQEGASEFSTIAPSSAHPELFSSPPVAPLTSQNSEYEDDDNILPTTKPTLGFGGVVWWESFNSSSCDRRPMEVYTIITSITVLSIVLQSFII